MLLEHGFKSFINVYTRTQLENFCEHFCLDCIFVIYKYNSNTASKIEAGVLQTNITDNFSTVVAIDIENIIRRTPNVCKITNYNKLNELLMREN